MANILVCTAVFVLLLLVCASAQTVVPLTNGTAATGTVTGRSWVYYSFPVASGINELRVTMGQTSQAGDPDLYILLGSKPNSTKYDAADMSTGTQHSVVLRRGTGAGDKLQTGTYYIGIFDYQSATATFMVTAADNSCYGMGCSGHGACNTGTGTCTCDAGWTTSSDCSTETVQAVANQYYSGSLDAGQSKFYAYTLTSLTTFELLVEVVCPQGWGLYAVIGRNRIPTLQSNDGMASFNFNTNQYLIKVPNTRVTDFTGSWIVALFNSRSEARTFSSLNLRLHDCPNACSGAGVCDPLTHTCACNPGFGNTDCSYQHTPLNAEQNTAVQVAINPYTTKFYSLNVTAFTEASEIELMVTALSHDADTGAYPTVRILRDIFPTSSAYYIASPQPLTAFQVLRVSRSALVAGTWYIGVSNSYSRPANVTLTAYFEAYCDPACNQHGTCTESGQCLCNEGYIGNDCSVLSQCSSTTSGGVVFLVSLIAVAISGTGGYYLQGKYGKHQVNEQYMRANVN